MSDQGIWYLENIDVTGIFCPTKMQTAIQGQEHMVKSYKKGEFIFQTGDHADKIFFIQEGSVKIGTHSNDGKEITKAILGKGEVFGELALIGENKRRDYAMSMEKGTSLCVITKKEMQNMMKDHNGLSLFIMNLMGSRALLMETRLESLVFKDSRSRVIEYLIEMLNKRGQRVGYEWVVRNFITHQEIANLTATSRQTVTTVLNELKTKDLIKFDRKRLLIRDREGLENELIAQKV